MYHITVSPDTFELTKTQESQNPYIDLSAKPDPQTVAEQHSSLIDELYRNVYFKLKTKSHIPDMVFVASLGLSLPRLPEPVVVLPNMRFNSRRRELKYTKWILEDLRVKTVSLPADIVFEGQAETVWFDGGQLLVVGYGFRSSKETVTALRTLLSEVYHSYGVEPPTVLGVKLKSPDFYHLDMAVLAYSPTGAIVQEKAFSPATVTRLREMIGTVTATNTEDRFALNVIVEQDKIISHIMTDTNFKEQLTILTGLPIVECDVSEFEKSGGAIRCLVFDLYDPRVFKRKNPSKAPSSPTSPKR